jgi:hypothetical protein
VLFKCIKWIFVGGVVFFGVRIYEHGFVQRLNRIRISSEVTFMNDLFPNTAWFDEIGHHQVLSFIQKPKLRVRIMMIGLIESCSFSMLVKQMHNIVQLLYKYVPICKTHDTCYIKISGVPRNFFFLEVFNKFSWGQGAERTGIWERYSPLVRGSTQFASEWNPYSE